MPSVTTRRPRIYYELRGSRGSVPLLMLRGLGRNLSHWGRIVALLEDHFRLLLLDNRGVGRSDVVRRPYDTAAMADDALRALDHAGLDRAHVFGTSLGGMIAQRLAIAHADRVDRLVLGCTSAGGRRAVRPSLEVVAGLLRARLQSAPQVARAEAGLLLSAAFCDQHPEVLDHWVTLAADYPVARSTLLIQLWAAKRHDTSAQLHRITAPTLIMSSSEDRLVPPDNSRNLARRISGSELVWLPGSAHDFSTEHPDATARILHEFLLDD